MPGLPAPNRPQSGTPWFLSGGPPRERRRCRPRKACLRKLVTPLPETAPGDIAPRSLRSGRVHSRQCAPQRGSPSSRHARFRQRQAPSGEGDTAGSRLCECMNSDPSLRSPAVAGQIGRGPDWNGAPGTCQGPVHRVVPGTEFPASASGGPPPRQGCSLHKAHVWAATHGALRVQASRLPGLPGQSGTHPCFQTSDPLASEVLC